MVTSQINTDVLENLIVQEPLAIAGRTFGDKGSGRLKEILRFIKRLAAEAHVGEATNLKIFALVNEDAGIDKERLTDASKFQFGLTVGEIRSLTVEIRSDGTPYVWSSISSHVQSSLKTAIVYQLLQCVETFEIDGRRTALPKVLENSCSQFFIERFSSLKEALLYYHAQMARTSTCYLLKSAWYDDNHLWFQAGPEFLLRRSLCNFLRSSLRYDDMQVRPEQNVDESHPVDIEINWKMTNQAAIIEIKWIGHSRNRKSGKMSVKYTDARARKGAKQLAEYLEAHRQEAATADTRGYLVVFDCRRRALKPSATTISRKGGLHYSTIEVKYNPQYHLLRDDFEEPLRMFLEPVCLC